MDMIFKQEGDALTVGLTGEIDHHRAEGIRNEIDDLLSRRGVKNLILDFSGVTFMDSSGIGVVLGRYKKLKAISGSVTIQNAADTVYRILEMSGVFSLITYRSTAEDTRQEAAWKTK